MLEKLGRCILKLLSVPAECLHEHLTGGKHITEHWGLPLLLIQNGIGSVYSVCTQGAKWFCHQKEMENKFISESNTKFYRIWPWAWAPDRHLDLKIRAETHIFWLKDGSHKNRKYPSQVPFQVTGWKYLKFRVPQKAEGASGWCPHFQNKSKYPWLGDACPSWGAVLQGSCNEVWLLASAREMCSLFCI